MADRIFSGRGDAEDTPGGMCACRAHISFIGKVPFLRKPYAALEGGVLQTVCPTEAPNATTSTNVRYIFTHEISEPNQGSSAAMGSPIHASVSLQIFSRKPPVSSKVSFGLNPTAAGEH